jgi:rare lipoprotein A
MLLNAKHVLLLAAVGAGLVGCGGGDRPERVSDRGLPVLATPAPGDPPAQIGDAYSIGGQRFEPKDENAFDEVGYAISDGGGLAAGEGLSFDPSAMVAAHRILPLPSYAEVTNLETGKTVVVRIVARGPMLKDRVAAVSPAALQKIGLDGSGPHAVRLRRVNPPEEEKAALRAGRAAPDRLDTPPSLLSALRRRLGETTGKPISSALPTRVSPAMVKPVKVAPKPTASSRPGAKFDVDDGAPAPRDGDRFIVEENGVARGGRSVTTAPTPAAPKIMAEKTAPWFVQIASFGDKNRAEALARKEAGRAVSAGNVWRVLIGPFADEAKARSTLGAAVAKGYRDARISH